MAEFFASQIDFFLFFNGLGWVLCGMIALSMARTRGLENWAVLGVFGLLRGLSPWLDLAAVSTGDSPLFTAIRAGSVTLSFVVLLEFARREGRASGMMLPGIWIHVPLLLIVLFGWFNGGSTLAVVLTRYCIALPAALGTGLATMRRTREIEGRFNWLAAVSLAAFLLYTFSCGMVVPETTLFPGSVLNETTFMAVTGIPIELVRGVAACLVTVSIGGIWGRMIARESGSEIYAKFLRRLFRWILVAMTASLALGWYLTEYFGSIHRADVEAEAGSDLAIVTSRFGSEVSTVSAVAKMLTGDLDIAEALAAPGTEHGAHVGPELDSAAAAAGSERAMLFDTSGQLVATDSATALEARVSTTRLIFDVSGQVIASDTSNAVDVRADLLSSSQAFRSAMAGNTAAVLSYDSDAAVMELYATAPVKTEGGRILGIVLLQRTLKSFDADLARFWHPYFLVDPDGVIVSTNRSEFRFRPLWPKPAARIESLRQKYTGLDDRPVIAREPRDSSWTTLNGERTFFRREPVSADGWSLVMALPPSAHFASRPLGLVITLLAALAALATLLGRERRIYDAVTLERRLELQHVAAEMETKASTDALTGLFNRMHFNAALDQEIDRGKRYGQPFSLMLFDADHFKRINDTFGHQVGDEVLQRIAQLVAGAMRTTDVVARWGGEEFVVLMPESDEAAARQAAEKVRGLIHDTPFNTVGQVTCSFGVAQWHAGEDGTGLTSRADEALYAAKRNGRNRVEVAPLLRAAE
jgi:diguanylate cyclase (GGDEF)-like protein